MEKSFPRDLGALDSIFGFVDECMRYYHIEPQNGSSVEFIIEELFTNMVKYSRPAGGEICINISRRDNQCVIVLTENDVDLFDITKVPEVDVKKPLKDRRPGGLGIFLVRKMADQLEYDYTNRRSRITIVKNLE